MKYSSIKFTKYNDIENKVNKNNEIILWEYSTPIIYISNKKNPIKGEYFIWSYNSIMARLRQSEHFMIDSTFHHPESYAQLMIILFKDIITSEMQPGFFILMNNKTEIMYDLIFKSIIPIITQYNNYNMKLKSITSDIEIALINVININFQKIIRINCFFHL